MIYAYYLVPHRCALTRFVGERASPYYLSDPNDHMRLLRWIVPILQFAKTHQ